MFLQDLVTELKNGLGQPWEYLIDALLQERGVADSYAVFDSLSVSFVLHKVILFIIIYCASMSPKVLVCDLIVLQNII